MVVVRRQAEGLLERPAEIVGAEARDIGEFGQAPVSYTHLTLPKSELV